MLNRFTGIGNLGGDPELRYTPSGKAVTNLRVAINSSRKDANGEWVEETLWLNVEAWEAQAERLAEQLRKGNRVYVEGQMRAREFDGNDGQKRTALELRFARVVSLERRDRDDNGAGDEDDFASAQAPRPRGGTATAAPPVRPRGARAAATDEIDVDDIPF